MDDQNSRLSPLPSQNVSATATTTGSTGKSPETAALSKVGEATQQAASRIKDAAGAIAADAGEQARGFARNQIDAGADFLDHIGRSVAAAADTLQPDAPQVADYVRDIADSVSDLSRDLRRQSPEALLDTASNYVRQNPALVLGAAAVCGFAVTRLLQGGIWNASRTRLTGATMAGERRFDAV